MLPTHKVRKLRQRAQASGARTVPEQIKVIVHAWSGNS